MPLYDYTCRKCSFSDEYFTHSVDKDTILCPSCGTKMTREFPCSARINVFPSQGIFLQNVSAEGKHFSTKRELKDFARDNNLELGALL